MRQGNGCPGSEVSLADAAHPGSARSLTSAGDVAVAVDGAPALVVGVTQHGQGEVIVDHRRSGVPHAALVVLQAVYRDTLVE